MIVQPDFLKHFKTQALVKVSRWEAAPLAVLRLWGHCQVSRRWQFPNMTPEQLAALCEWGEHKPGCATALLKAGFIRRMEGGGFEAHQWEEQNSRLVHNWKQGANGGRPKKSGGKGSKEGEKSNPVETQGFSSNNPAKTDQIRSDQIREDQKRPKSKSGGTGDSVKGGTTGPVGGEVHRGIAEGGGSLAQDASAVLVVPEFEPVPEGMFRRELEPMLAEARKSRARVESSPAACVWREVEREGFAEDVAWHENLLAGDGLSVDRRAKLEREFAALKAGRMVRVRGPLTAQAVAVIGAWSRRIEELEKAIAGVRR